jgi:hypothetical protein
MCALEVDLEIVLETDDVVAVEAYSSPGTWILRVSENEIENEHADRMVRIEVQYDVASEILDLSASLQLPRVGQQLEA